MAARGSRVPNQINHSSRRVWDGAPPPSTPLSGFEVTLSGIRIGFSNPDPGVGDDLRLRYRPEAECISFEGPNSRGMLVPLEEMLLKDNIDGTVSVFFKSQFRRKYYVLEGSLPRVCDYIQAYKNELNLELHMLCYVAGNDPITSAANFIRRVKQGRQSIPLVQRSTDFPAYSTYRHPQPHVNRNSYSPNGLPQPPYRRNSYHPDPEQYPGASTVGSTEGPRVRFQDHPPPPVPQPPSMESYVPLRGGAGSVSSQFREYEYEEQFARTPRDPRSLRNPTGSGASDRDQFARGAPRDGSVGNEFEQQLPPRDLRGSRSQSRSQLRTENWERNSFEQLPPRDLRDSRSRSRNHLRTETDERDGFEPLIPPPTPQPQKRMFALVFKRSPMDHGVEIRPASIDSSHERLMRQASSHWNLRELRLYGHVDGLKMNLNSQADLEAYVKLCDSVQRLLVDVE